MPTNHLEGLSCGIQGFCFAILILIVVHFEGVSSGVKAPSLLLCGFKLLASHYGLWKSDKMASAKSDKMANSNVIVAYLNL